MKKELIIVLTSMVLFVSIFATISSVSAFSFSEFIDEIGDFFKPTGKVTEGEAVQTLTLQRGYNYVTLIVDVEGKSINEIEDFRLEQFIGGIGPSAADNILKFHKNTQLWENTIWLVNLSYFFEEQKAKLTSEQLELDEKWIDAQNNISDETLEPGEGFIILSREAKTITIEGIEITENPSIDLVEGWNFIGIPTGDFTAQEILDSIGDGEACSRISAYDLETNSIKTLSESASIENDVGYFIECQEAVSGWVAEKTVLVERDCTSESILSRYVDEWSKGLINMSSALDCIDIWSNAGNDVTCDVDNCNSHLEVLKGYYLYKNEELSDEDLLKCSSSYFIIREGDNLPNNVNNIKGMRGQIISDVDGDGDVTEIDVELMDFMMLYKLAGVLPSPSGICCLDVDLDGEFSGTDVEYARYILEGAIKSPGVCGGKCLDSDGGIISNFKGKCIDNDESTKEDPLWDYCYEDGTLAEMVCSTGGYCTARSYECQEGYICEDGICVEELATTQPGVCVLSNARWSAEEAVEGDIVLLMVDVEGCVGETEVVFTIYESEFIFNDKVGEFKENMAVTTWTAEYRDDGIWQGDPEYVFKVKIGDVESEYSEELSVKERITLQKKINLKDIVRKTRVASGVGSYYEQEEANVWYDAKVYSSATTKYGVGHLIDGKEFNNYGSYWLHDKSPAVLYVKLSSEREISKIRLSNINKHGSASDYKVQYLKDYSDDSDYANRISNLAGWTDVPAENQNHAGSLKVGKDIILELTTPIKARYLRIELTRTAGKFTTLNEIELWEEIEVGEGGDIEADTNVNEVAELIGDNGMIEYYIPAANWKYSFYIGAVGFNTQLSEEMGQLGATIQWGYTKRRKSGGDIMQWNDLKRDYLNNLLTIGSGAYTSFAVGAEDESKSLNAVYPHVCVGERQTIILQDGSKINIYPQIKEHYIKLTEAYRAAYIAIIKSRILDSKTLGDGFCVEKDIKVNFLKLKPEFQTQLKFDFNTFPDDFGVKRGNKINSLNKESGEILQTFTKTGGRWVLLEK